MKMQFLITLTAVAALVHDEDAQFVIDSVAIAGGAQHTCMLESARRSLRSPLPSPIVCWGSSQHGMLTPPLGNFVQVSAGLHHSCGMRANGTVACWGVYGLSQSPIAEGAFVQVTAGNVHSCALRTDGSAFCWGKDSSGQLNLPTLPHGVSWTQLSAGKNNVCGLRDDERIACWGSNQKGQSDPTPPNVDDRFVQVSCSLGAHCCALRKHTHTAFCWGSNMFGQTVSPPGAKFVQITTGERFSCGLRAEPDVPTSESLLCWGMLSGGAPRIPASVEALDEISAGQRHVCAVARPSDRDAPPEVLCFGSGSHGVKNIPMRSS